MNQGSSSRPAKDGQGRKVNVLLYVTERVGRNAILPHLLPYTDLHIRVIRQRTRVDAAGDVCNSYGGVAFYSEARSGIWEEENDLLTQRAHQHARWAQVLFVEMGADAISAMLAGLAYDTILGILRCWGASKKVIILPELSVDQRRSPIWKRQLAEIKRNWNWIEVVSPAIWDINVETGSITEHKVDYVWDWEGPKEVIDAICSAAWKIARTDHSELTLTERTRSKHSNPSLTYCQPPHQRVSTRPTSKLPPELWTLIFEYLGDWEYAAALGIYTTLPTPPEWLPHIPRHSSCNPNPQVPALEYLLLTASTSQICSHLISRPLPPTTLSHLAVKLIFKFSLTPILSHLASHQKDIFWTSFGLALIPHKASTLYNNTTILEWWRSEPAILKKEYGPEALDGASRAGFADVLEWWARSGLEMRYTEKALESASAKGHIDVLEWWKKTSLSRQNNPSPSSQMPLVPLKVGKSILAAAQSGRAETVAWWDQSGIAYSHEEGVARLASAHGHVNVLELWREIKGTKMIFDNQVLVGATKNGHADVLEWWKRVATAGASTSASSSNPENSSGVGGGAGASAAAGLRVEYKTCDIEEAMEDSLGGVGEGKVRDWWERNGLNLGVGTNEWMKVKSLGGS